MKKSIIAILSLTLLLSACASNGYRLEGKVSSDMPKDVKVFLYSAESAIVDSTAAVDGKFSFKGEVPDSMTLYFLVFDGLRGAALYIPEKGVQRYSTDEKGIPSISGGALNDDYYAFAKNEDVKSEQIIAFITKYKGTPLADYVFGDYCYGLSGSEMLSVLPALSGAIQASPRYATFVDWATTMQKTDAGNPYLDVKGLDFNGKELTLSQFVNEGKVVLVDFWASWCGPCRRAMPMMRDLNRQFQGQPFTIVGISLDDSKEKWAEATAADSITWPQFSNLQGWKEPAAAVYGVRSIPSTILIGKDGTIVGRNLEGEKLAEAVAAALK